MFLIVIPIDNLLLQFYYLLQLLLLAGQHVVVDVGLVGVDKFHRLLIQRNMSNILRPPSRRHGCRTLRTSGGLYLHQMLQI